MEYGSACSDKVKNKVIKLKLTSSRFEYPNISENAENEIDKIKLKDRSFMKLEEWGKYQYYKDDWCKEMLEKYFGAQHSLNYEKYDELSVEEFRDKYEKLNLPVIITGASKGWKACDNWNFEDFYQKYKDSRVKVGEDDDGYKLKIYFKYFLEYLVYNKDDSPLYFFESSIEDHKELKELISEYQVPKYFKENLFELISERRRPPYRWFLMGPERSGTAIHFDPLGTSAWNTSLTGHKLWLLLPPETPRTMAKGKDLMEKGEDDEAIIYLRFIFPRIKQKYKDDIKETIFIQKPGETVFIPGGWWHVVVNLDDTIAITQNYCNTVNFPKVWTHVRKERKKLSVTWLEKMSLNRPDVYETALQLNERDNFVMFNREKHLLNKKIKKESLQKESDSSSSSSSSSDSDSS